MIKPLFTEQNPQVVLNEPQTEKMRLTPQTTKAVVLARGPGIEKYKPEQWQDATKYGVNAIEMLHKVKHLVVLDDPFLLIPSHYTAEEWQRIEFLKQSEPEYLHTSANGPMTKKAGYRRLRHKKFDLVGLFDKHYAPHWLMSAFTAVALAARHGHKEITVYGVTVLGHRRLEAEKVFIAHGWKLLNATFAHYGIKLYIGHEGSILNGIIPIEAGAESSYG